MFCPKCGAQIPDGSRFCGSCGSPIEAKQNPAPVPPATGVPASGLGTMARGNADLLRLVRIACGAVLIVGFFLPAFDLAGFLSVSGFQMTFGTEVFGSHVDGEFFNILLLAPGVLVLVSALALVNKAGDILTMVAGALELVLIFLISNEANSSMHGYFEVGLEIGAVLSIIVAIACIVLGTMSLVSQNR